MKICRKSRKRSRVAAGSYSSLSEDILIEILSKLPVKSLIRFRCVSQEWNALIKDAYFISRHLSCSDPHRYIFLDYTAGSDGDKNGLHGLSLFHDNGKKFKFTSLELPFLHKRWSYVNFLGSSSGLVCFLLVDEDSITKKQEDSIVVCNPATRDFRYLPTPTPFRKKNNMPLLGFEFMHDTREFKVVCIFPYGDDIGIRFQALVFTQSTNSWRQIMNELKFPASPYELNTCISTTVNGVLYWMAKDAKSNEYYALCFNMYEEVFHVLPLPMLQLRKDIYPGRLPPFLIWENSLALLLPSPSKYYQVLWVLTKSETTTTCSWTQQFRMGKSSFPRCAGIMGALKDQLLLLVRKKNFVLYDPVTKKTRKIPARKSAQRYYEVRNYVRSLLPTR